MKYKKSMTMKKGPDEESKRMMAVAREQREQMQVTGRKQGPAETLKRAKLEDRVTKKGNAMSSVAGQQHEPSQNNVRKAKTKERTGDVRRNNNKEGESKNLG